MKRDANLDLIRSVAIVFVLLLHFVMGSGWYGMPDLGFAGWTMELCRALFVSCVPLFLLLSGYLCAEKTLSARYYLGLVRIYVVYLLSCALSLFVRIVVLKEDIGLRQAVGSIFSHQANEYSWYVSMYTGLFLLIPFLNAGYAALKSRRQNSRLRKPQPRQPGRKHPGIANPHPPSGKPCRMMQQKQQASPKKTDRGVNPLCLSDCQGIVCGSEEST